MDRSWLSHATFEKTLYGALVLGAFLLRIFPQQLTALAPAESVRALAAWQLAQGKPPEWWDAPGLVLATGASFALLGASDATARLLPALAGAGLVAALWLYRGWLGRWPALVSAGLLAFSPTGLATDRAVSEASLAALLTLLLGWGTVRFWEEEARLYPSLGAAGAALLLHLGYPGITGLMALVLFAAAYFAVRPQGGATAPAWLKSWPRLILPFLGAFLLLSTGVFLFLLGFGLPSLQAWVQHFEPPRTQLPWSPAWIVLLGFELPVVVLGMAASLSALARWVQATEPKHAAPAFLSIWALLGLAFFLLGGGVNAQGMFVAVLPLTVLTGSLLGQGLVKLDRSTWKSLLVHAPFAGVLMGFAGILLAGVASGSRPEPTAQVVVAVFAFFLATVIVAAAVFTSDRPLAGLSVVVSCLVLLFTLHSASSAAFSRTWPGASRVEPRSVAAVTDLLRLSPYTAQGQQQGISIEADLRQPMAWYLRDTPRVAYVTQLRPGPLLLVGNDGPELASLTGYQRRSLPLLHRWVPTEWGWAEAWRWFLTGEIKEGDMVAQRISLLTKT